MRCLLLSMLGLVVMAGAVVAEPVSDDERPMSPGLHQLEFAFEHAGEEEMRRYGMYLPREVKRATVEDGEKLPLVVFLYGTGSRGLDERGLQAEGPLAAARGSRSFRKTIDYAILVPQIDRRERYENARSGAFIAAATRRAVERWPIDPDRVYLVGMSMGGGGVWYAAKADPKLWALVASFAGYAHEEPDTVAEALKETPIFLTVGSVDSRFVNGSVEMAKAFKAVDADLTYFKLPGRGHDVWRSYLGRPAFFEWVLSHRRGESPPKDRATAQEMADWALNPPGDPKYHAFMERMKKQFDQFARWWHIDHCGMVEGAGLHDERLGRKDVFVTHPLNGQVPCQIMITVDIPEDKRTTLHLEVAHADGEDWLLRVYVDGQGKFGRVVGKDVKEGQNWHHYEIDLTEEAGKERFIEILSSGHHGGDDRATWGRIELVSEAMEAGDAGDAAAGDR